MTAPAFALFDTAIGACAVAWSDRGLVGAWLPEADAAATRARILRRHADALETPPPPPIRAAVEAITALLAGQRTDLADIPVDLGGVDAYEARVLEAARTIPPGRLVTYGELAAMIGDPDGARAVGVALGRNPIPIVVPCHRIVGAGGKLVGFSAPGGVKTKRRLLEIERARLGGEPDLFDPR
jgi:methylated-DNA-[protein]-cysteine S-methyltransferase